MTSENFDFEGTFECCVCQQVSGTPMDGVSTEPEDTSNAMLWAKAKEPGSAHPPEVYCKTCMETTVNAMGDAAPRFYTLSESMNRDAEFDARREKAKKTRDRELSKNEDSVLQQADETIVCHYCGTTHGQIDWLRGGRPKVRQVPYMRYDAEVGDMVHVCPTCRYQQTEEQRDLAEILTQEARETDPNAPEVPAVWINYFGVSEVREAADEAEEIRDNLLGNNDDVVLQEPDMNLVCNVCGRYHGEIDFSTPHFQKGKVVKPYSVTQVTHTKGFQKRDNKFASWVPIDVCQACRQDIIADAKANDSGFVKFHTQEQTREFVAEKNREVQAQRAMAEAAKARNATRTRPAARRGEGTLRKAGNR